MPPTDADLLARVLAGDDRRAFAELVRRHQSKVRSLLRKLTAGKPLPNVLLAKMWTSFGASSLNA